MTLGPAAAGCPESGITISSSCIQERDQWRPPTSGLPSVSGGAEDATAARGVGMPSWQLLRVYHEVPLEAVVALVGDPEIAERVADDPRPTDRHVVGMMRMPADPERGGRI